MAKTICFRHPGHKKYLMCDSKTRYDTAEKARQVDRTQRVYGCPYCKGYHLATKKK